MRHLILALALVLFSASAHALEVPTFQPGDPITASQFNDVFSQLDNATNGTFTDAQLDGVWTCQKVAMGPGTCQAPECRRDASGLFYVQDFTMTFDKAARTVKLSSVPSLRDYGSWPGNNVQVGYVIKSNSLILHEGGVSNAMSRLEKKSATKFFMYWNGNGEGVEITCTKN